MCSRGDLATDGKAVFQGCYDSKVTSVRRGLAGDAMGAWAVNGPTDARWPGAQPTFDWRTASEGGNATGASHSLNAVGVHGRGAPPVNHFGQPDVWEFDYEFFAPRWPPLTT